MRIKRHSRHPVAAGWIAVAGAALAVGAVLCAAPAQADPVAPPRPDPVAPAAPDPVVGADGAIGPGITLSPYDTAHPAVAGLDPMLRTAVQNATREAAAAGIDLRITSGWRSDALQRRMLDDAIYSYGSFDAARQWVAPPEVSRHVTGRAVDVGPPAAAQWLIQHGPRFGLCQVYANEPWHFELTGDGFGGCPPLLPDAAG